MLPGMMSGMLGTFGRPGVMIKSTSSKNAPLFTTMPYPAGMEVGDILIAIVKHGRTPVGFTLAALLPYPNGTSLTYRVVDGTESGELVVAREDSKAKYALITLVQAPEKIVAADGVGREIGGSGNLILDTHINGSAPFITAHCFFLSNPPNLTSPIETIAPFYFDDQSVGDDNVIRMGFRYFEGRTAAASEAIRPPSINGALGSLFNLTY